MPNIVLELVLEIDPQSLVIPAHIWTPWFSVLGSKSGFDSLEECFEDSLAHIYALETGLSSDPAMNWRVGALDRFLLVSNSDAHSPQKLAREANLFAVDPTYPDLAQALRSQGGLCRHPGVLPPGRQIPPGRPPQLRPAPHPGGGREPRGSLPRVRQALDLRGAAPGSGSGGPARGRRPPPGPSPTSP